MYSIDSKFVSRPYNPLSRLTNVLSRGQLAGPYSYDLAGNLTAMRYGDGVTNLYRYDAMNRVSALKALTVCVDHALEASRAVASVFSS
jgi:YD repeat-containing protein